MRGGNLVDPPQRFFLGLKLSMKVYKIDCKLVNKYLLSKHSVFIRPVLGADEVAVNSPDKVSVLILHRRQICKLGREKGWEEYPISTSKAQALESDHPV